MTVYRIVEKNENLPNTPSFTEKNNGLPKKEEFTESRKNITESGHILPIRDVYRIGNFLPNRDRKKSPIR